MTNRDFQPISQSWLPGREQLVAATLLVLYPMHSDDQRHEVPLILSHPPLNSTAAKPGPATRTTGTSARKQMAKAATPSVTCNG